MTNTDTTTTETPVRKAKKAPAVRAKKVNGKAAVAHAGRPVSPFVAELHKRKLDPRTVRSALRRAGLSAPYDLKSAAVKEVLKAL